MDTLHVVTLIPSAWKAIAGLRSFAIRVETFIGIQSVIVHSMGFSLVSKETRVGRELRLITFLIRSGILAAIWP